MVAASAAAEPTAILEARRAAFAKLMALSGSGPADVAVEDREVAWRKEDGHTPVRLYVPAEGTGIATPGLVFIHGGGLVAGSLDTHDALCRSLAAAAGCRVIAVDYRLAPEHKFPAGWVDCCATVRAVIENSAAFGIAAGRVAIAGDSAGGALAAVTCHNLLETGIRPVFQLLLCPITDFTAQTQSRQLYRQGYMIDADMMAADLAHYLPPDISPADPRVSPLHAADLRGLCSTYIHTAEADPLHDEGKAYAQKLQQAGVEVHYSCHPGMIHLFYGMAGIVPYARTALAQIGSQIRDAFAAAAAASGMANLAEKAL
jgi:acetyl esterase/lipase